MNPLSNGIYPASVTPMLADGRVDEPGLIRLIARFRDAGCAGVVLAGTNGEGPSLSTVEKRDMVRVAVGVDLLPVIAGISTASLEEAIWLADQAHKTGAIAGLVMPPAYFREASESGISAWFQELMGRTKLPILLYNFPSRSGFSFRPELIQELAKHDGMAGIKDSSCLASNLAIFADALKGAGKRLYVGDESLILKALDCGWNGAISGAANIIPRWLVAVLNDAETNRESAETKFELIAPLIHELKSRPQPPLNKALLAWANMIALDKPRLPLLPPSQEDVAEVWKLVRPYMQ